jgi:predicted lipid-binding transport protein (Tim44 family)
LLAGGLIAALFFGGAFEGMQPGDWLVILLLMGGLWWFLRRNKRTAAEPALVSVSDTVSTSTPSHSGIQIGRDMVDEKVLSTDPVVALPTPPSWFDVSAFEQSAVEHFKAVQQAWDAGDTEMLRAYCSPKCFAKIEAQLVPEFHQTQVEQVTAQVIDWDYLDDQFVVSVRFSGLVSENGGPVHGFTEIWHIARAVDGSGDWKIIGIQQL